MCRTYYKLYLVPLPSDEGNKLKGMFDFHFANEKA